MHKIKIPSAMNSKLLQSQYVSVSSHGLFLTPASEQRVSPSSLWANIHSSALSQLFSDYSFSHLLIDYYIYVLRLWFLDCPLEFMVLLNQVLF